MISGSLAERLRVLRAQRGMTLVEAAEQAGVGRDTLSDLERGRRHPVMPTLAKIARGYGVPVEELLEEPVPLADAPRGAGQTATEEKRIPGVAPEVLSRFVNFTSQLADAFEAEIERVKQDRTFPHFAWDYRAESAIFKLIQDLDESEILPYVAEVREGRRMAQNESRRLVAELAANLSRLRHLVERARVAAQTLSVDSDVEVVRALARPVSDVLEEWETTPALGEVSRS